MIQLLERNFKAVVDRGLITTETCDVDFFIKLKEEVEEVATEIINDDQDALDREIVDCFITCSNWLIHRGANIPYLLAQNAIKNEERAKRCKR